MEMTDIENAIKQNPVLCLYYILKSKEYLPENSAKLMPVLGSYLLDEIKRIDDPDAYHAMDIKLNKLGNEASDEYNRLYKKASDDILSPEQKNLVYAQSLLAQCVAAAFALAWDATAMLSGKDYKERIQSGAAQFVATAAGSDSFKDPAASADFETLWLSAAKDLKYIPEFPASRSKIREMLSATKETEKKGVLAFLLQ
jgi:hypothetical protein